MSILPKFRRRQKYLINIALFMVQTRHDYDMTMMIEVFVTSCC